MSLLTPPPIELDFPEHLPVCARRDAIIAALHAHQVVIVCGETGSGKTTQLPKIALAAGRGQGARIGMTQPRRIAAKSVAQRIAQELHSELGGVVGWQVRFTDQVSERTRIKVMTDGILLAETQSDPAFLAYDTLILDEAHERSLNIDFLLGYLHTLLPRRPELRLVVSSATLEAERFSAYFGGAPVVEVSGRTWPVEVRYRGPPRAAPGAPTADAAERAAEAPDSAALLAAVDELAGAGAGDILVFLPGEREIRDAQEALRKHHPPHTEILPLFARLSVGEQERVFAPHGGRRIVLATNVAETSLTVPGIRYVVDAGLARVKRYSLRHKVEQLKIEKVSQAAANQRAGRCGRVAAGICIRLYDEADFLSRPRYTTPELLRSSLAGVILRMKSLRLAEIDAFPFLDPPEPKRVRDGQQLLLELGALDAQMQLTELGRQLARLPLDPRLGRMLIAARERGVLHEALVIAAFLSVQDPRERPLEAQAAADEKHRRLADPHSDFVTVVRLWQHIDRLNTQRKSQRKFREALQADFLAPNRVREWRDVYGQLMTQVKELGWKVGDGAWAMAHTTAAGACEEIVASGPSARRPERSDETYQVDRRGASTAQHRNRDAQQIDSQALATAAFPAYAPLHQALMTGLLGNLGMLTEDGVYLGARELKFLPFPGSGLKKKPKWVMAAEIVDTRRVYARTLARIEPEWVEQAARHLLKVSYGDPHWAKRPAHVVAAMRATLYGLPVVNGRPVHYGPIDPVLARALFIRAALVGFDWDSRAAFMQHNRQLCQEIEDLAQRTRNARLAVDPEAVYAFFDARVPAGIHNGAAFDAWRRDYERQHPRGLYLTRATVLGETTATQPDAAQGYPAWMQFDASRLALSYRFAPGTPDDGVTLEVPLAALNQVSATVCDWLVPGLLQDKIAALIKGLPQGVRRNFIPVPEFARAAAEALAERGERRDVALPDALAEFLASRTGQRIAPDAWRPEALPAHLHMHYRVLDETGATLASGRDLAALRAELGVAARQAMARSTHASDLAPALSPRAVQQWDFGPLPDSLALTDPVEGGRLHAFPALQLTDNGVALALLDTPAAARHAHRLGVARLIWQAVPPAREKRPSRPPWGPSRSWGGPSIDLSDQTELLKQTERDLMQRLKSACLQHGLLFGKDNSCVLLVRDITVAAALAAWPDTVPTAAAIRSAEDFAAAAAGVRPRLPASVQAVAQVTQDALAAAHRLTQALDQAPAHLRAAVADLRAQLAELVFPGFLLAHPAAQLPHLPRYLKAMTLRLDKLPHHLARDQGAMNQLAPLQDALRQRRARHPPHEEAPELTAFFWQVQELRVSLFAQELKTPMPVSVQRLQRRWQELSGA